MLCSGSAAQLLPRHRKEWQKTIGKLRWSEGIARLPPQHPKTCHCGFQDAEVVQDGNKNKIFLLLVTK